MKVRIQLKQTLKEGPEGLDLALAVGKVAQFLMKEDYAGALGVIDKVTIESTGIMLITKPMKTDFIGFSRLYLALNDLSEGYDISCWETPSQLY